MANPYTQRFIWVIFRVLKVSCFLSYRLMPNILVWMYRSSWTTTVLSKRIVLDSFERLKLIFSTFSIFLFEKWCDPSLLSWGGGANIQSLHLSLCHFYSFAFGILTVLVVLIVSNITFEFRFFAMTEDTAISKEIRILIWLTF